MRIIHVSDAYLPKQGGIEVQVHDLAARQAHQGHEVRVVTCAQGADEEPDPLVPVLRMRSPWVRIRSSNARLRAAFAEADVVHAHLSVLSPLSILAVRAAALDGTPVVVTLHSLWWLATPLYWIADRLVRWGSWRVQWTAVSALAAAPLERVIGRRAEVTVLPNAVDPADWAVDPLPRDPDELVVASVMRLAARKRPKALLRVVRAALPQLPPGLRLRVLVIGDGPLRADLERRIGRWGLAGRVELLGRLDRQQIRELYRRADLYLAPATLESFGIAALEARCAGLPVIARAQTGIADFIRTGEQGILARTDDGLTAALVQLAGSPQQRAAISAANRAQAPETGWSELLQRCELCYKLAHDLARHP